MIGQEVAKNKRMRYEVNFEQPCAVSSSVTGCRKEIKFLFNDDNKLM